MKLLDMCSKNYTALIVSAVFVWAPQVLAQVQDVDASVNIQSATATPAAVPEQPQPQTSGSSQGDLLYQLQLLQQEVMQLRGMVEEQAFTIKQLKNQSMERYIDLDRRLGQVNTGAPAGAQAVTAIPKSSEPVGKPRPVVTVAQTGEKEVYDAAYALVVSKRFYEALEAFKQFLIDFPDGKYAPNSYYWMGELYQVVKPQDLEASRQAFTQLLDLYPNHSKAADAMYKLGKVHYLKGNKVKSRQWLDKVVAEFGNGRSSAADKARQFINANF